MKPRRARIELNSFQSKLPPPGGEGVDLEPCRRRSYFISLRFPPPFEFHPLSPRHPEGIASLFPPQLPADSDLQEQESTN